MTFSNKSKKLIGILIILGVSFILGKLIWSNWDQVEVHMKNITPLWCLLSILVLTMYYILLPFIYNLILKGLDEHVSFKDLFVLYYQARSGRYIPGKMWSVVGLIVLGKRKKISVLKMGITAVVGILIILMTAGLHSMLLVHHYIPQHRMNLWFIMACIAVFMIIMNTSRIRYLTNKIVKKKLSGTLGVEGIDAGLSYGTYLKIIAYCWVSWIIYGFAGTLFIHSVYPLDIESFITLNSMFALAYLIGYLSILVPGGIGIQEGIITLILSTMMSAGIAAGIAVMLRVWLSFIEFLFIGCAFYLDRKGHC